MNVILMYSEENINVLCIKQKSNTRNAICQGGNHDHTFKKKKE